MQKKRPTALPWIPAAGVLSMLSLLLFPDLAANAARDAMTLSVTRLIPLLFPYSVLSSLMIRRKWLPERGLLSILYGLPGDCEGVLFSGIAAGFPVGAEGSARLLRDGSVSREDAGRLAAVSSVPSPAFLAGAVGSMWGDVRFGWFLWIAANLTLLLFSRLTGRKSKSPASAHLNQTPVPPPSSFSRDFSRSVTDAAGSCLAVTAFVAFFRILSAVGAALLPAMELPLALFLEFSSGVRVGAAFGGIGGAAMTGISAGFGGLSVLSQIAARNADDVPGGGFSLKPYLFSRIVLSAVLGSAAALWASLFSPEAASPVFLDPPVPLRAAFPVLGSLLLLRFSSLSARRE